MICKRLRPCAVAAIVLALAGCEGGREAPGDAEGAAGSQASPLFQYHREYIFLSTRGEEPLVVPIVFRSSPAGGELHRGVRGWLARGSTWDRFLDESGRTSPAGGVWRVVPQGDLRITAGGVTEIEALRFQRGERRLRLELDSLLTGWNQGGETRFRLLQGRLTVGSDVIAGPVLELLRVEETLEDGWPPGQDFDALFLTSGDSLQIVLAETLSGGGEGEGFAWLRMEGGDRMWDDGVVRWLDVRTYQEARRDIPTRWSFHVPGAAITGEVEAVGFDATLGPERGGRRAVEIRYTVKGWVELQGTRRTVTGTIRHTQQ